VQVNIRNPPHSLEASPTNRTHRAAAEEEKKEEKEKNQEPASLPRSFAYKSDTPQRCRGGKKRRKEGKFASAYVLEASHDTSARCVGV
jgi:hypothetical protein